MHLRCFFETDEADPDNLGFAILAFSNMLKTGVSPDIIRPWLARFSTEQVSVPDIVNLANLAFEIGELELAQRICLIALSKGGSFGPAHLTLGMIFEARGEKKKAKYAYENASKLMPQSQAAKEGAKRMSSSQPQSGT